MPFEYHQVSRAFIGDLFHKVRSGESVVLLGQRFGGKRHVIKRLRRMLDEQHVGPVINLPLLSGMPIATTEEATKIILDATARAAETYGLEVSGGEQMLDPLERLADHLKRPVILMAANVDGMAHHLARSFLRQVRMLTENRKLVAVASGEEDFHDLVHGDNSEFTCANQFVLQGYDEEEFYGFIERYQRYVSFRFEPEKQVFGHIWRITGGNIYLLRIILWAIVQMRTRADIPPDIPVTAEDVPNDLKLNGIPGAYGAHVFRHATQLIDRERDVWEVLEDLLRASRERMPPPVVRQNPPTILELSGVAVRRKEGDGHWRLAFASPLMEAFITQYYDHRRLGDLYGSIRRWGKAVEHYRELPPEARLRPSGADDRGNTEIMVSALVSTLHSEATRINQSENPVQIIKSLENIFTIGCRYLLGFREVTFWDQNAAQQWTGWEYRKPIETDAQYDEHALHPRVRREIQSYLPVDSNLTPGIRPMRDPGDRYGLLAVLPGLLRDESAAVVVSDFEQHWVIWRERARLIDRLLKEFVAVYTHAVKVYGLRRRRRQNRQYIEIINDVFHQLGSPQLSVQSLLKRVARALRERVDYKRVVFSLVDPERRMIDGFLDDSDNEDVVRIHNRIHWKLDDPTANIHPYVINTKEFRIFTDIATDSYVDRKTMMAAGIKSGAVVPLTNPNDVAIGTILVERRNGVPPSHDDANDLKGFGQQLAIAIEQCERVNMLEECLNKIPEPLLIVDRTVHLRYQNQPAAALFNGRAGWHKLHESSRLTAGEAGKIVELIRDSLKTGHRTAAFVRGVGIDPNYEGEVVADTIADWRGNSIVAGGLLRILDRTYLNKYFEAERKAAAADSVEDTTHRMLQAMESLGHQWGRFYRVRPNENGDEVFYSVLCYGQSDERLGECLNRDEIVLAPRSSRHKDWRCIEDKVPVVFCYLEGEKENNVYITPHGLRAINWPKPQQPEQIEKSPGDFWLDIPLVTNTDTALGKICLQCSETLKPEHFELLKHLSNAFTDILEAAIQRKFNKDEEERTIKVTLARKIMGTMAHNIGTRHGSLHALLSSYRRREKRLPELAAINERFGYTIDHVTATIMRAKELLSPVTVRSAPVGLVSQIRRSLEHALPEGAYQVTPEGAAEALTIPLDAHRFDMALLELVQNSFEAADELEALRINITVGRLSDDGRDFVSIIYEDNGPGVPAEAQPYIFIDYFTQRPDGKEGGLGLGMGYVLRVVEGHGGRISYVGQPGEGAKFLITLPLVNNKEAQERTDV